MMRTLLPALLALVLLVTATGCLSFSTDAPEKGQYLLAPRRPGAPRATRAGTALEVRPTQSTRESRNRSFVYMTGDHQVEVDYYHEFAVLPTEMLREQTRRWLRASGLWQHVIDGGSRLPPTHLLEATILLLRADYRDPDAPRAILEVEFQLLSPDGDDYASILDETYKRNLPVADDTADALVATWDRALGQILTDLEADMIEALPE